MEDIELVIKIPKEKYNEYKRIGDSRDILFEAIRNGTPIDKYEPCITMSRAFANSVTYVKILKDENEELKNKINKIITEIEEVNTYDGIYIDRAYVLEIIDKYKAESED